MSDIGRWTKPMAQKKHFCQNCGRVISKGEKYYRYDGIYGGRASSWKECAHCAALITVFKLWDIYMYDEGIGPDEIEYWEPESLAGLRAKVQWKRAWTRPDGSLYPVPS